MKHHIEFTTIKKALVTCIIPLRISYCHIDAIERLEHIKMDHHIPEEVNFCVVDDGSSEQKNIIKKKCDELGYSYIYIDSPLEEFSIGRCRNVGAMYAKSKFIFFQDVDLMPYDGFYKSLIDEIYIQALDKDAKKFLMVPYIFLTEDGSNQFINNNEQYKHNLFLHKAIINDSQYVEKISCGTSANLFNRIWYLSRGGNSMDFAGWGYEDLECNTRMIRHLNIFPTPRNWEMQKYNFSNIFEYSTWKASYRLFGDLLFNKGIVLFHRYHERSKSNYTAREQANRALFIEKMAKFVSDREEPEALPDMNAGKTLLLKNNAFTFSRTFRPLLGKIVVPSKELLSGKVSLNNFVKLNNIRRVIFHNPYNDQRMHELYLEARAKNIKHYICERGALPDSCFFDDTGFLVDSESYKEDKWNHELPHDLRENTINYIRKLRESSSSLETQQERQSPEALKKKLGITTFEKVLLIVFQRPNDSVVVHFAGEIGNYSNFINLVRNVAENIPTNWKILAKKHPLEDETFSLPDNVQYIDAHIHDLLEISDTVLTFNSGVGVLSMVWDVSCILCGQAFYQNDKINTHTTKYEDVIAQLITPKKYDPEYRIRFISYLLNEHYSFGKFITKSVKLDDGKNMTATLDIIFYRLKFKTECLEYSDHKMPTITWDSLLFDRYKYSEDIKKNKDIHTQITLTKERKKPFLLNKREIIASKHRIEATILRGFLSQKKYNKYIKDRNAFFVDSKSIFLRAYYAINK